MEAAMRPTVCLFLVLLANSVCAQHTRRGGGDNQGTLRISVPFPYTALTYGLSLPVGPASEISKPGGATVSTNQLLVPPKATKELHISQRYFKDGKLQESIEHLDK